MSHHLCGNVGRWDRRGGEQTQLVLHGLHVVASCTLSTYHVPSTTPGSSYEFFCSHLLGRHYSLYFIEGESGSPQHQGPYPPVNGWIKIQTLFHLFPDPIYIPLCCFPSKKKKKKDLQGIVLIGCLLFRAMLHNQATGMRKGSPYRPTALPLLSENELEGNWEGDNGEGERRKAEMKSKKRAVKIETSRELLCWESESTFSQVVRIMFPGCSPCPATSRTRNS